MLPAETYQEIAKFINLAECRELIILSTSVYDVFQQQITLVVDNLLLQQPKKVCNFMAIKLRDAIEKFKKLMGELVKNLDLMQEYAQFEVSLTKINAKSRYFLDLLDNNGVILRDEIRKASNIICGAIAAGNLTSDFYAQWESKNMNHEAENKQLELLIDYLHMGGYFHEAVAAESKREAIEQTESAVVPLVNMLGQNILLECDKIEIYLSKRTTSTGIIMSASNYDQSIKKQEHGFAGQKTPYGAPMRDPNATSSAQNYGSYMNFSGKPSIYDMSSGGAVVSANAQYFPPEQVPFVEKPISYEPNVRPAQGKAKVFDKRQDGKFECLLEGCTFLAPSTRRDLMVKHITGHHHLEPHSFVGDY